MNYYRMTQRPVQEEIYDYFDHLGMMHQCDLPLFSFLRRPQFSEAVRQVGEMEHLVRRHVSTVMVTFINEPMCIRRTSDPNSKFSRRYDAKGHRNLLRDELEAFFAAARKYAVSASCGNGQLPAARRKAQHHYSGVDGNGVHQSADGLYFRAAGAVFL